MAEATAAAPTRFPRGPFGSLAEKFIVLVLEELVLIGIAMLIGRTGNPTGLIKASRAGIFLKVRRFSRHRRERVTPPEGQAGITTLHRGNTRYRG